MLVIPAIDLKDGHCVRLKQGRMDDATDYGADPVAMARRWVEAGARRLHLVDLNGAFAGRPVNAEAVTAIAKAFPELPIQIGGGIRSREIIERYFDAGVSYVIIGTKAVKEPEFVTEMASLYGERIIVGLDAHEGMVATDGWAETSNLRAEDLARRFAADGVGAIIYTDISRDGMMQGVNVDATAELARKGGLPVIASGGVTNLDDIRALVEASEHSDIMGAITGRAIYEGTLNVADAQRLCDEHTR